MIHRIKWKPVPGFEGIYIVSSEGDIVSVKTGQMLIPYNHTGGYLKVDLKDGTTKGHGKQMFVHRIVAQAFLKNENGYPQVNHKDGNKKNNRAENLEWCTQDYNMGYFRAMQRLAACRQSQS